MAFPRRLLRDGEELVLDLRPHWIALALPVFVTVVAVAAATVLTVKVHTTWLHLAARVLAALAVVIWAVPKTIQWATPQPMVPSARLLHRTGPTSVADELSKLETLRRQGVISDAEFEAQKSRLLGS